MCIVKNSKYGIARLNIKNCTCGKLFYRNDTGICVSFIHEVKLVDFNDFDNVCSSAVSSHEPSLYVTKCLRCTPDDNTYFKRDLLCVYNTSRNGTLQGCINGAHLRKCEHFECQGMFKCKGDYYLSLIYDARHKKADLKLELAHSL